MVETKDAKDAEEKEGLSELMDFIYVDNVLEKKQKKWALKNIHRSLKNYVK